MTKLLWNFRSYSTIIFFILVILVTFVQCRMLHERMTREEIFSTFHTTPEAVPRYHIVRFMHDMHKRDANGKHGSTIRIRTTNTDIENYLEPNQGQLFSSKTKVWTAHGHLGLIHYLRENSNTAGRAVSLYLSRTTRSIALVSLEKQSSNDRKFYGQIGDMAVWPLPTRLRKAAYKFDQTNQADLSNNDDSWSLTNYHVLYARSESTSSNLTEALTKRADYKTATESSLFGSSHRLQGKRSIQNTIYPSLLILADFNDNMLQSSSSPTRKQLILDRVMYILAFVNGVDLRFRALQDPKVRLHIAGIVLGVNREAFPYIDNNRNGDVIDADAILAGPMASYWQSNTLLKSRTYHAIVALTNSQLISGKPGQSTSKSLCLLPNNENLAIISDRINYSGIPALTTEVGHWLGADYDGVQGAAGCSDDDGYIMSHERRDFTANNYKWSSCSLKQFVSFLRYRHITCMDNDIITSGIVQGRLLPGKLLSAHEQCRALGYSASCEVTSTRCEQLRCYSIAYSHGVMWWDLAAPAEGTSCDHQKICLNGECVDDVEPNNKIWNVQLNQTIDPFTLDEHNTVCPDLILIPTANLTFIGYP